MNVVFLNWVGGNPGSGNQICMYLVITPSRHWNILSLKIYPNLIIKSILKPSILRDTFRNIKGYIFCRILLMNWYYTLRKEQFNNYNITLYICINLLIGNKWYKYTLNVMISSNFSTHNVLTCIRCASFWEILLTCIFYNQNEFYN